MPIHQLGYIGSHKITVCLHLVTGNTTSVNMTHSVYWESQAIQKIIVSLKVLLKLHQDNQSLQPKISCHEKWKYSWELLRNKNVLERFVRCLCQRVSDIQAESLKMLRAFQLAHSNWDIRWWKNGLYDFSIRARSCLACVRSWLKDLKYYLHLPPPYTLALAG